MPLLCLSDCSLVSYSYKQDCASETLSPLIKIISAKVGKKKNSFQVTAHQNLVNSLAHQCSCEFWGHLLCVWCCWYEITEPQATFPSLLSTKSDLLVLGIMLFICMSLYSLNMSFMESIILRSRKCSGMGLYRVDCTPPVLHTFFLVGTSLLGGLPAALAPLVPCGD